MIKLKLPKVSLEQVLTLREKAFFALAMLGMLILFWNAVWNALGVKIASQQQELKNLEGQIEGLQKLLEGTRMQLSMQSRVPQAESTLDEKTKRMLERKVVDPLSEIHTAVGLLSSRRIAKNVKIDDVRIGEMIDKSNYSVVPLSIDLTCRYGAVRAFFKALEDFDRPLVVRRFSLKRGDEEGGAVKASIDAELYIVKR